MSRRVSSGQGTPWHRVPLVWMLIAIPLAAVIAGFFMLRLAILSDDGMVVDDYYKHGKEINRVLERDQAASARKLSAVLAFDFAGHGVTLQLASGTSYTPPDELRLQLLHATRAGFDINLTLARQPGGEYLGPMPGLREGRWHLLLEADDWRLLGELRVPGDTTVSISAADE